jgi:hypothetical protein
MTSDNFDNKLTYQHLMSAIFEWLPVCALVIDPNGVIHEVNQQAIHFFRATTKEDFIFDKQNIRNMIIDSHRAAEMIKVISKSTRPVNQEILIRRFDKTIACVDLYACLFPDNPKYILLQFSEKKPQNQVYMFELSQAFRREAQRLRPYLNKAGRKVLDEIIIEDMAESIVGNKIQKKNQVVVVPEERMEQLKKMYPEFSNNDLIFCGYLSLKMSIDEISSVIDKTPNSLRVTFHRILKKTTFATGREFLRKLESL